MEQEMTQALAAEALEEPIPAAVAADPPPAAVEAEAPPAPPDVTERLAEEFLTLAEEFPALVHPSDLPREVLDTAAGEGIPLLDAYLRYRWQEEKKVAAATESRRRAAQCSAGSLSRTAAETPPEQDAFLRAFRSAL